MQLDSQCTEEHDKTDAALLSTDRSMLVLWRGLELLGDLDFLEEGG